MCLGLLSFSREKRSFLTKEGREIEVYPADASNTANTASDINALGVLYGKEKRVNIMQGRLSHSMLVSVNMMNISGSTESLKIYIGHFSWPKETKLPIYLLQGMG